MKLSKLLKPLNLPICDFDPEISSIHYNARDVRAGGLFVAVKGEKADGHDFIKQAFDNGAVCAVTHRPDINSGIKQDKKSIIVSSENTRKILAKISSQFYANPSEDMFLIGITGTNGKTTTSYIIESILLQAGFNVGVIGTVNYRYQGRVFDNPVTTPESLDLQKIMASMRDNGVTHVVMEVSSHGIELCRIYGCRFDIGVFTNLTQDHLDFHHSMQSYWECKKSFFTGFLCSRENKKKPAAIINCNNQYGRQLFDQLACSKKSIGNSKKNMIYPVNIKQSLAGISANILTANGSFSFLSGLVGDYNLENILCAVGAGIAADVAPEFIKTGIENMKSVPGRLEKIENNCNRYVYVDYAHTPDALENVLNTLRALSSDSKVICVFGCGGDRDKGKRPIMGKIAVQMSDFTVITSDNPRTEDPLDIINDIINGVDSEFSEGKDYVTEPDRKKGIKRAIDVSEPGDVILIAGKGHESYQIIGKEKFDFDDSQTVREMLLQISDCLL